MDAGMALGYIGGGFVGGGDETLNPMDFMRDVALWGKALVAKGVKPEAAPKVIAWVKANKAEEFEELLTFFDNEISGLIDEAYHSLAIDADIQSLSQPDG